MQTSNVGKKQFLSDKSSSFNSNIIQIERNFDVPVEILFSAFSSAEALKVWWWPEGMHASRVDLDFRQGGSYFIDMQGFEEGGGGMTGHFEEIIMNKRLVMTDSFSDNRGHAISAKEANMPGNWPEMIYITFEFKSLGKKASGLKLLQEGIPNELQKDCIQGWQESFDKLEKYLSEI